ncbi:restriction endonuclease subunit S [Patescibacteria group bacterium]|nr:restriction endonuclease subunit S [Patescibacteria group bacterium]
MTQKNKQDWQIKKLGDLCIIELGKTPYRGNHKFWDTEKLTNNVWLSIADLLNVNGNVISDSKEYISDKGAELSKIVKKGTLLASFKLTLGRLAFAGKDLYTNEAIAALTIRNEKEISKDYLYHFLSFFDWHSAVKGDVKIKGKTLNKAKLKEIKISYPESLSEQHRIVKILDEVFEKTAKAKENAEKNLQNAKKLFESYLQGIFANPGKNWEEKRLAEVCDLKSGTTIPKSLEKRYGDILYVKVGDMNLNGNEVSINSSSRFVNLRDISNKQIIPEGSVIFPKRGGAIFTNKRRKIIKPTIVDLNTMALVPSISLNPDFLYYWFLRIDLSDLNNGSSIPQINNYSFDNVYISFPKSIIRQKSIVAKLDALSAETKKLESIYKQKLTDLEELKKSVLKKAFTGEL